MTRKSSLHDSFAARASLHPDEPAIAGTAWEPTFSELDAAANGVAPTLGERGDGPPEHVVPLRPDDVAFVIYTSGSTGRPKGVMQTHRNMLHNAQVRLGSGLGLRNDDRIVLLASLGGGQGIATVWSTLLTGATLCPFPAME